VANTVENISTYLSKSKRSATMFPSDTVVRHQIPLKPGIFHGRDDLVEEIAQLLVKKETAHVCLLGPGGMGKTSVSLAVVELPLIKEQFPGGNCVWVPCIEATSAALLLEILYIQLQVPGDKQVTLEKIISHLNASKQPRLILLDNFETPWNAPGTGTQKQIEDILRQLAELSHIAIFITMRGTNPPCNNAIHGNRRT
jgi:ATP-dependent Clp protease ATP-binding subunit ClpA